MFVMCLCKTWYQYAGVHEVNAYQPIGQAVVRAASAPQPVTPPPPMPSFITDGIFRRPVIWQPWYGRYAREAAKVFVAVGTLVVAAMFGGLILFWPQSFRVRTFPQPPLVATASITNTNAPVAPITSTDSLPLHVRLIAPAPQSSIPAS